MSRWLIPFRVSRDADIGAGSGDAVRFFPFGAKVRSSFPPISLSE
jgi:hypothetical protein